MVPIMPKTNEIEKLKTMVARLKREISEANVPMIL
jgi:hypothetical protein